MIWNSRELEEALNTPNKVSGGNIIQFNSEHVNPDDIFIALPGGTKDSHLFVQNALDNGAALVIISKDISSVPDNKKIVVVDTMLALRQLMTYKRLKSKAKFIAITGSVGKTSTKEAIKLLLQPFGKVFISRANFNNILGVPLNLASMPNDVDFAIFELGMNHSGEIMELTKLVKPEIAIITAIAEVHIANFESIYGIIKAKSEIFFDMPQKGIAIINDDNDEYAEKIEHYARKHQVSNIYFFGKGKKSASKLVNYVNNDSRLALEYSVQDKKISFNMPLIPLHFANNFASGLLLLDLLDKDLVIATQNLANYQILDGRGKVINLKKGDNNYQMICDYYSSNPTSLRAALMNLATINHPNKIIFMGDMLELGDRTSDLHAEMVPDLINSGASKIVLVGEEAPKIASKLPVDIEVLVFNNIDQVISKLPKILTNNELMLVKGSKKLIMWKILTYFDHKEDVI